MVGQVWEVVGGADKGGIIVRESKSLTSELREGRLSVGAQIQELALEGDRLQFRRLTGSGPSTGWVSLKFKDKPLVTKIDKSPEKDGKADDAENTKGKFDPYAILEIPSDATDAMIKSAFRKMSVKRHPDRNPDDPDAAEKFRELVRAKEFLLSPIKRLIYNAHNRLIKPTVNTIWWSDWDEIFDEIDTEADALESAEPAPAASLSERRNDILVVGATGLVGTMACMVLQRDQTSRLTWAIVGRDGRKLERLEERFGQGPRFRGATRAETPEELAALARTARAVVDFRGPMYQVGTHLAEACMEAGTHYIINSGDHLFTKVVRDRVHREAEEKGLCVLTGAGINCQLADFGVWCVVKHLREHHGLPTRRVDMYTHMVGQMFSGTMVATGLARDKKEMEKEVEEGGGPFFLGGTRRGGKRPEDDEEKGPLQDPYSGMWAMPNASPERYYIRASCGLFDGFQPWGDRFLFKNWTLFPDKLSAEKSAFYDEYMKRFYKSSLEQKKLPPPGAGPNERLRQECFITCVFVAEAEEAAAAEDPLRIHCILRAGPGGMADRFEGSAIMALEATACFLEAADSGCAGTLRPGWGTPTWHLAHLGYFERLVAKFFNVKIVNEKPQPDFFKNLVESTLPIGNSEE